MLKSTNRGGSWEHLDTGTYHHFTAISFPSTSTGWVAGSDGVILQTSDGGSSWTTRTTGTSAHLRGIASPGEVSAIAVGDAAGGISTIRYTMNGGSTWLAGTTSETSRLNAVAAPSSILAWAVGANGTMIRSTDNGASWTATPAVTAASLNAVAFAPGTTVGYVVGNNSGTTWNVLKTTDGISWTRLTLPGTAVALDSVACAGATGEYVVVAGANGTVLRSLNGGATWTLHSPARLANVRFTGAAMSSSASTSTVNVHLGGDFGTLLVSRDSANTWLSPMQTVPYDLRSTVFTTANTGWAVGNNGLFMRTADGGNTWTAKSLGAFTLRGAASLNLTSGWVVGDNGTIRYTTDGGATWTAQSTSLATQPQLNGVFFDSPNKGTIVGNSGTILTTSNSGSQWSKRDAATTQPLNGVWYASNSRGWVVGGGGIIRATTTGGANWNAQPSGTTRVLRAVWAADTQNVYAVGDSGTVLKTTNGGTTWTAIATATVGTAENLRAVGGSSASKVWVAGDNGVVRLTTDGGATWTTQAAGLPQLSMDVPAAANSIRVLDTNNAVIVGGRGAVRTTSNGGLSWTPSYYGTFQDLEDVSRSGVTSATAVGANGSVIHTFDGGASWFRQVPNTAANLNGVTLLSSGTGWAVGDNGTVRYTTNNGWTWTTQTSGTTARLTDVDAASATNAIAVGSGAIRYTTTGTTWSSGSGIDGLTLSTRQVNRVSMPTTSRAWAVTDATGTNGVTVLRTLSGGLNWVTVGNITTSLYGVHFLDDNTGWVAGAGGAIYKTTNGGTTWVAQDSGTTTTLRSIRFASATQGRAVGDNGVSLITTDGGATWTSQGVGTTSKSLRALALFGDAEGWAVGSGGTVLRAYDLTDPYTTLLISPLAPNGENGWYVSSPLVQLVPSAGATAYYSWLSDAGPFSPYLTPLVASEGTSTLHYFSTDTSGQVEPVRSEYFKVDLTAPTTPTAVAVSDVSSSSVTATWINSTDAISGVVAYEAVLTSATGSSAVTAEGLAVDISELVPNTAYTLRVYAIDEAGLRSAASSPVYFTTLDAADAPLGTVMTLNPATPDGRNGWYVTTPTVTLESVPDSLTVPSVILWGYDVSQDASLPYTYANTFYAAAGAYTISYASSPTVDTLRLPIRRYDESLTVDPDPMPAVTSLTATPTPEYTMVLTWDSVPDTITPSGLESYEIYRNGTLIDTVSDLTTPTVTYEALGLDPSTTYTFGVRSVNAAGTKSAESTIAATSASLAAPDPPRIVYARGTDGDSIYVNWEPVPDAIGTMSYHIYRMTSSDTTYSQIATVTGQFELSYVDTSLRSSTQYWYRIQAEDDRDYPSAFTTTTVAATTRPPRPEGLSAVESSGGVVLSWTPSTNPAVLGYYVKRYPSSFSNGTTLTVTPQTATTYVDPALPDGTYWYRVAAIDANGEVGPYSVEYSAQVARVPDNPSPHGDEEESDSDNDACPACHRGHSAFGMNLSVFVTSPDAEPEAASQEICLGCHNGVMASDVKTGLESVLTVSRHAISLEPTGGAMYCGSCHEGHRSNEETDPVLLDVGGVRSGTAVCYECHGPESMLPQGDLSVFEQSVHAVVAPDTRVEITCHTCHEPHSSNNDLLLRYSGWMLCMQCHGGRTSPTTPDILSLISASDDHQTRHDLTAADQLANGGSRISCQNCHNTHAVTTESPLVDPDNPSTTGPWTTDLTTFCFRCHDGELPTAEQTEPWVQAPLAANGSTQTADIESAYDENTHGYGESTVTALYLRPEMGYSTGDVLSCDHCHDGHGTVNPKNLRQNIRSADGGTVVNGLLVAPVSADPLDGYDLRFFCGACHDISPERHLEASADSSAGATSIETFPMNCMGSQCHGHMGESF